jgi:hypothetical protein
MFLGTWWRCSRKNIHSEQDAHNDKSNADAYKNPLFALLIHNSKNQIYLAF